LGKSEELIEFVNDRLGHDKRYAIDPSKLEKLGWKPMFTFDIGMVHTVQWYIDNQHWWKQILSREYQHNF
jgi:dTDP-glucose 4,6-dehydratase